jgi:hypothetical protein
MTMITNNNDDDDDDNNNSKKQQQLRTGQLVQITLRKKF